MDKYISLVGNPQVNQDGTITFTFTNGHLDMKVTANFVDGEGYKIKNYEVYEKGANNERSQQA